ncbi:MAG: methyltransferase domain-containing protein [Chitinophagaceae bacterium]|nr:MAG: methyltransferase domain-containing protein [Chitinophagaceae bacterium]
MSNTIHYNQCPVCGSGDISKRLSVIDSTVSGEVFAVFHCANCSLRFTQDIPDADSIGKYYKSEDYISHTNTSKGLVNRLYQLVRKRTLKQKRKLIEEITGKKNGILLDVGSGIGAFATEMKNAGWQVTGLEPDEGARKAAEDIHGIKLSSIEEIYNLPAGNFDIITLWHVLEHVSDLGGYIKQFNSLLKPDGKLFIAVPNYTSLDADVYKQYWAAYDVPRHLYHFTPKSMKLLMKKNELEIIDIKRMWFDSFYVSLLSSKNKHRNIKWISACWIGLRSNLSALINKERCSSLIYVIAK